MKLMFLGTLLADTRVEANIPWSCFPPSGVALFRWLWADSPCGRTRPADRPSGEERPSLRGERRGGSGREWCIGMLDMASFLALAAQFIYLRVK